MASGFFISFEGGEGSGKTTQAKLLAQYLRTLGYDVVLTREPGGTELADQIRSIVVRGKPQSMHELTESLLFLAARCEHWLKVISPALERGAIVICDRFQDSTLVYQGICGGINLDLLETIFKAIPNIRLPDLTFLLDIDPIEGLNRSLGAHSELRFEQKNLEFHQKVREGFLSLAESDPRWSILDGHLPSAEIFDQISKQVVQAMTTQI